MSRPVASTRTVFVLVTLVTLILIVGSAILNRIVFKAASADAALYFDQSTVSIKPETNFTVNVLAQLSSAADISGAQFELNFDPSVLKLTDASPAASWKQAYSKSDEGKLLIAIVPLGNVVHTDKASSGLELVTLTFRSVAEGVSGLTLTNTNAMLAVSAPPLSKGIENVVQSVVDAQVRVSTTAPAAPSSDNLKVDATATTDNQLTFSSQRLISTEQVLTPDSAVILVRLEHPARVSVAFGQTATLGNRADYSTRTDQAAVRIAGLTAGQRYFYQVVAEDDDAANRVLGQVKSFELPTLSATGKVDRAELTVFSNRTANDATAYALFFDSDQKVVSGLAPQLQVDKERVSATRFGEVTGLYQASLRSLETKKLTVRLALTLDGQQYATASAVFDPSNENAPSKLNQPLLGLQLDQPTINLILALVAGLILLGLGFYKLARAR